MIIKALRNIALCIIVLIMHNAISIAQVNLVANPSFELIYSCPNAGSQIDTAIGWSIFKNGGGNTPDLYAECCTNNIQCEVPFNSGGFQFPKSGKNYVGIMAAWSSRPNIGREYIQSKLNKKLKSGEEYCVKYYCNLSDISSAYIKSLGAYLDSGNISTSSPYGLPAVIPQVYSQQSLIDSLNWMKIEGFFVATGIEEYISIGNFFSDSFSGLEFLGSPTNWMSYYYIDDVSVIDANLPAYAGNDTLIHPGDSVFIGRQPEIGLDEDCIWFVNGQPIDTMAGMWVQPDTTTTYIVQQTICGNVKWDTVTVSVYGMGIEGRFNEAAYKVYPNPATNLLTIECSVTHVSLSISNLLGQEVLRQSIYDKVSEIDISRLEKGVYFVNLSDDKGLFVCKLVIE